MQQLIPQPKLAIQATKPKLVFDPGPREAEHAVYTALEDGPPRFGVYLTVDGLPLPTADRKYGIDAAGGVTIQENIVAVWNVMKKEGER